MADVERLVTVVDLDERSRSGHSAWAYLYVVLSSGERDLLLADRGWTSGSAEIAREGVRQIQETARMVVGPDGPGRGETDEQMRTWYWDRMEGKLCDAGINAKACELQAVPHDVEIGERLRHRLAMVL